MINQKRFLYTAERMGDGKRVVGRIGSPFFTEDGKEKFTHFSAYVDENQWKKCIVATNSIRPYNGIHGYKVFEPDWTCMDKQYTCPGVFEEEGELEICNHGMRFCRNIEDCFRYHSFRANCHVAEVIAWGDVVTENDRSCTNKLEIVRELSWDEVLKLSNSGEYNTGCGNKGSYNTGNFNAGIYNTGRFNEGNHNDGNYNHGHRNVGDYNFGSSNVGDGNLGHGNVGRGNTGNQNTGHCNDGDYNAGDFNLGQCNTGDFNKSSHNTGCFNTEEETIKMFNKPSDWTYSDWEVSKACYILFRMPTPKTTWMYPEDMTEVQKENNPMYKTTKGCLIPSSPQIYPERQEWWDGLSQEDKDEILSLPNFDATVFQKCTGIKVN